MRFTLALITIICCAAGEQLKEPAGILTSVSGNISIIRVQITVPKQAHILDYLFKGDTLVVNDTSSVTIFYKNGALLTINTNQRLEINSDSPDTLDLSVKKPINPKKMSGLFDDLCTLKNNYDEMVVRENTEAEKATRCVIQYPGNTALINARPDVIWNKYPGANWYTMRIQQGSAIVSSIATTDTVFSYPQNQDDMPPGNYEIKILAVHNSDTLCKTTGSLTILDSLSVYNIHQTIEMIAKHKPDNYTFHLLKAVFFRKNLLRLMAIESYKELLAISPGSPVLYKGMAELYYGLGVLDLGDAFFGLSRQTITTPQIQNQ